jgi:hypothetical protein
MYAAYSERSKSNQRMRGNLLFTEPRQHVSVVDISTNGQPCVLLALRQLAPRDSARVGVC